MQDSQSSSREPGLRARKRLATLRSLESSALSLALQYGVDNVTVDQVAAHANVSRRTFFNYFASLTDALIGRSKVDDALDPVALFRSLPASGSVLRDLQSLALSLSTGHGSDVFVLRQRLEVLEANPQLTGDFMAQTAALFEAIAGEVSQRMADQLGEPRSARTDRWARMLTRVCAAALHQALDEHRCDQSATDVAASIREAFTTLEELKEHYL